MKLSIAKSFREINAPPMRLAFKTHSLCRGQGSQMCCTKLIGCFCLSLLGGPAAEKYLLMGETVTQGVLYNLYWSKFVVIAHGELGIVLSTG